MVHGPPLPLSPEFPLLQLAQIIQYRQQVGAWIRNSGPRHRLTISAGGRCLAVVIGEDLGELLGCCAQVVVRAQGSVVIIPAEAVIRWRALQVVTGTPHLPSAERLKEIFPDVEVAGGGFRVPMQDHSPEEVLANCLAHGIQVMESRVVYVV
jgi:hypothetical protein